MMLWFLNDRYINNIKNKNIEHFSITKLFTNAGMRQPTWYNNKIQKINMPFKWAKKMTEIKQILPANEEWTNCC